MTHWDSSCGLLRELLDLLKERVVVGLHLEAILWYGYTVCLLSSEFVERRFIQKVRENTMLTLRV